MKRIQRVGFLLALSCAAATMLRAQSFDVDAQKQGLKGGVHWVKRTWYLPKPSTTEADKSAVANVSMRPSQLIEYNKEGKLRSVMDYRNGTNDVAGPHKRWYYTDGRLTKHVQENVDFEPVFTTIYAYDAAGHETRRETKPGPGDRMKMATYQGEEMTWTGANMTRSIRRNEAGAVQSETSYTHDAAGRVIREDYKPLGLYSARTYVYDAAGNVTKDTYFDRNGLRSTVWTTEYNAAGKPTQRRMEHFYNNKKDSEEVTTYTYNPQGDLTAQKTTKDGKTTYDYTWQLSHDAKGNRIQTVHIKGGTPELVEVLELRYY